MGNTIEQIELCEMHLEDIDEILEIEVLCFSLPWSRDSFISEIVKNKLAKYIVAKIGENIVGYAGIWKVIDEGHITNIAVHPNYRGKKIGTRLVQGLIDLAKHNDIERITLEVRKSNTLAQNLYKKFGFEEFGLRKKYYCDDHEDAVIMWKVIS